MPHGNLSQGSENIYTTLKCNQIRLRFLFLLLSEKELLTFAKVRIEGIGVKRRRANAFARLHAFLVRLALVVAGAPLLSRGAEAVVRVTAVTVRADALMRSCKVYALCPVPAHLVPDDALVYI